MQRKMHRSIPNAPTLTLVLLLVLNLLCLSCGNVDWQYNCFESKCLCQWKSGKKSAECRNASLTNVPTKLSSEIQVLDLSHNVISELRRDEFAEANLRNLHRLLIRSCTLIDVNQYALEGLEILIELDLSDNNIKILWPGTFKTLQKLRTVYLNNNEIEKLDDKLFDNLPFLQKIELKDNHIKKVGLNTFNNVPLLLQIYLDNNQLQMLRKETFQKLEKLTSLSLTHNPFNCTCEMKQFRDYIIDKNLYIKSFTPNDCKYPVELQNKFWSDIPSDHFACGPSILQPRPGSVMMAQTENATLACRVRASPRPSIDWIYNKRAVNSYDKRISIQESVEVNKRDSMEIYTSELVIVGLKASDRGTYTCIAKNRGGIDEANIAFDIMPTLFRTTVMHDSSDMWWWIVLILIPLGIFLLIVCCMVWWFCKKKRNFNKNSSVSENGLVPAKSDKMTNDSMLEGGSVIMEMQKSLLTEVNPVEKPPRSRTDVDAGDKTDYDDASMDVKKTLLDESLQSQHDDETHSLSLSDARSRTTFVDDGCGTNLPPDLLTFNSRFPQSPSIQSSLSNIHDLRLYSKSPMASPVYQPTTYTMAQVPSGFRTLQHPKTGRTIAIAANRSNSPFTAAPIIYPPTVHKQGYVTIPRKSRTSWTPSNVDYETTLNEPVYDNLGARTTATGLGNSVVKLNKMLEAQNGTVKYTMKELAQRPLPPTPSLPTNSSFSDKRNSGGFSKLYDNQPQVLPITFDPVSDKEPLYTDSIKSTSPRIVGAGLKNKVGKVPPKPPPKPKKRISLADDGNNTTLLSNNQSSSSTTDNHFGKFEDETEDGTEV